MARFFSGGGSDGILTPSANYFSSTTGQSVSFWVYVNALPASYAGLVQSGVGSDLAIYLKSSGALALYASNQWGRSQDPYSSTPSTISTGAWHNIVFLASSSAGTVLGYIDGSVGTNPGGPTIVSKTDTYSFGYDPNNAGRILNGSLADIAFWNVDLTAAEATALANGARPSQIRPKSLAGWWPLTGLQSPEPDLSGSKNNGTVTGTTPAFGPPLMAFTPRSPQYTALPVLPVMIPAGLLGLAACEY